MRIVAAAALTLITRVGSEDQGTEQPLIDKFWRA